LTYINKRITKIKEEITMKKLTGGLIVVLVLVCFTSMAFAASKPNKPSEDTKPAVSSTESSNTIIGKIVSIDKAKNEIVVKDQESKTDKAIFVEAKDIKILKVGNLVKIVLAPGTTDKAGSIEIVKKEKMKKDKSGK
jgi:hypothetical protein